MKTKSRMTALTTVALLAMGVGGLTSGTAISAETSKSPEPDAKDLDAQLADARARLEQAARDVAELSTEMGKPLMDKLYLSGELPSRAVIGVQLDPESGKEGARIREVSPGGPADEAGLHVGDVITAINGTDIKGEGTARQVVKLMRKVEPESKVNVRVTREGKPRDVVVIARHGMAFYGLQAPPLPPLPQLPDFAIGARALGPVIIHGPLSEMELASLTPQLGRYFGTDKGVLVVRAPKDFKLEDGDVILAIDGREPTSGSHATRILGSYQPGEKIAIKVMRQQKIVNLETTLPERGHMGEPGMDRKVRIIEQFGQEAERFGHETERLDHETERLGHEAERFGHETERLNHEAEKLGDETAT